MILINNFFSRVRLINSLETEDTSIKWHNEGPFRMAENFRHFFRNLISGNDLNGYSITNPGNNQLHEYYSNLLFNSGYLLQTGISLSLYRFAVK
jgi:hypothetical protein